MEELKQKRKGWFKVGNVFFDVYAKNLGSTTAIVYLCIKRHMDLNLRTAFPSEQLIAEKLDLNRRTVIRAIKKLESHRFIIKEKSRYRGRWLHNTYYLTQSREWLDHVTKSTYPCDKDYTNELKKSHINNTHINNTNIKKNTNFNQNSP